MNESSRQILTAAVALALAAMLWPARCPANCHPAHAAAPRLGIPSYPAPRVENQGAEQAPGDAAERPEQPAEQPEPEVATADELLADMPDTLEAFEEWAEKSVYEGWVEPVLDTYDEREFDWYRRREAIMRALTRDYQLKERYLNEAGYLDEVVAKLAKRDSSITADRLREAVDDSIDRFEDMYIEAHSNMRREDIYRLTGDENAEVVGIPGPTERIVKAQTEGDAYARNPVEADSRNVIPGWAPDNEREPDPPTPPGFNPSRPSAGGRAPDLDTQIRTLEREIRETVERIDDANEFVENTHYFAPIHKVPGVDSWTITPEQKEVLDGVYDRVRERAAKLSKQGELEQAYLDKSAQLEALRKQREESTTGSSYLDWFFRRP
jgi:hypothetical protein